MVTDADCGHLILLSNMYNHYVSDKEEACSSPKPTNDGECQNPQFSDRFFYNSEAEQCEGFTWNGCGTHKNNFKVLVDCEACIPKKGTYTNAMLMFRIAA